jgi:hypothetical protein
MGIAGDKPRQRLSLLPEAFSPSLFFGFYLFSLLTKSKGHHQ